MVWWEPDILHWWKDHVDSQGAWGGAPENLQSGFMEPQGLFLIVLESVVIRVENCVAVDWIVSPQISYVNPLAPNVIAFWDEAFGDN